MTTPGTECRLPAEKGSATSGEAGTDTSWRLPASRHRRLLALLFDPAPETEPPLAGEDQGRLELST